MVESFRHKGLKRLYDEDDARGIQAEHLPKVRRILARLDSAVTIDDMNLPGFKLHSLKCELKGFWSVTIRANWRIIFQFVEGKALKIDYIDYHRG